ncbi:MFS transporter [Actinomadura alba]|uniref:MFS transporter n=1 Tax=Actinomadura alba TaxID=406431 RepID=A0ABR7LR73_9ACTN|nr:MFS transporter [Actinomadura alba]MBC6467342.1 MFS transporter [Actinomadura alba]
MPTGGMAALRTSRPAGTPRSAGRDAADRQAIAVVIGVQVATALGYYAVMGHLVAHLRDDAGLLAGTIGLVLGTRFLVQSVLQPLLGALTDVLGPPLSGVLACGLRVASFALLATADGPLGLLGAACLLGAGGSLYQPAVQALIAGTSPARRPGGFAAYLVSGQVTAVVAPLAGLAVLNGGGFGPLAAGAALCWAIAGTLFLSLFLVQRRRPRTSPGPGADQALCRPRAGTGVETLRGVATVARDRAFLRFAVATAASMLLAGATTTVVPLRGFGPGWTTLFFCVAAAVTALVQPWCATGSRADRPRVLQAGMLLMGACYLVLLPLDGGGLPQAVGLVAVAALGGAGQGLMQPSIFQSIARYAPPERVGAHLGVFSFLSGITVFAGGLVVGALFDAGPAGATTALAALAVLGAVSAAACARPLTRRP